MTYPSTGLSQTQLYMTDMATEPLGPYQQVPRETLIQVFGEPMDAIRSDRLGSLFTFRPWEIENVFEQLPVIPGVELSPDLIQHHRHFRPAETEQYEDYVDNPDHPSPPNGA